MCRFELSRGAFRGGRAGGVAGAVVLFLAVLFPLVYAACAEDPGRRIYVDLGCPRCHGASLAGTANGPPLRDAKYNWTQEELVRFLENPSEYARDNARLQMLIGRYRTPMPTFTMSEEMRWDLAAYLLRR